ncbi:hypothetical protein LX87_00155 [Larkinella arboricola]|uniref:Uncharacterized protein n=1 Tax=Larkinella arboricola TaxID=643671 RepID=A0A327X5M6_LARAB|nr:hypothetical protein [Larkinella arboricola]RAK02041.1 hypothetical protein LX87_00155 [Larkinella arboricola]
MKPVIPIYLLVVTLFLVECKTSRPTTGKAVHALSASIDTQNFLSCCDFGTKMPDGNPVWCEASAVLYDNGTVFFANDKDMPAGLSPVMTKPWKSLADSTARPTPLLAEAFRTARKYEDFASNKEYVFLTTAFDRVKPGSSDWDSYNTILYWKKGQEANPQVLAPERGAKTSVAFRDQLGKVLAQNRPAFPNGMPYFKVEGLAVMDTLLLFGIREEGEKFDKFDYRVRVVAVPFFVEKTGSSERIVLKNNWRIVADFDPSTVTELPKPLALSSLEYDRNRNLFWMLTSIESNGQLDAYVWTIKPEDLLNNRPPTLLRDANGQPVHFNHKAEDLTFPDAHHVLVIHDDDRTNTTVGTQTRQPNQAAYTVLRINP